MKRLVIQFIFFFLQNPLIGNFFKGKIYQGGMKRFCTPGLNCYSCPGAVTSCPIGAAQLFFAGAKFNVSLFVTGFLLMTGMVFGRFICGYVCPMGLIQDLIYRLKTPKLRLRLRFARYIKYVVLLLFVVLLPLLIRHELSGLGEAWFCKYICPSGTVFGAVPILVVNGELRESLGWLFVLKVSIAIGVLGVSVFVYRYFCRVLCPLGAFYAVFNRVAVFRMSCDKGKCTGCGSCREGCDVGIRPDVEVNSAECVRCGGCVRRCGEGALTLQKHRHVER